MWSCNNIMHLSEMPVVYATKPCAVVRPNMVLSWTCPPMFGSLTLLHSEQPKLNGVLAVLSAVGLRLCIVCEMY